MLYFWNVNQLVTELQDNRFSSRTMALYFLAYHVLAIAIIPSALLNIFPTAIAADFLRKTAPFQPLQSLESTILLIIFFLGAIRCYFTNTNGDDRGFIPRFVCLSLPVAIRLLAAWATISLLTALLTYQWIRMTGRIFSPEMLGYWFAAINIGTASVGVVWMNNLIRKLSGQS